VISYAQIGSAHFPKRKLIQTCWEHLMTLSWVPDLGEVRGPLYWRIAAALARDIKVGRLSSGERLPTHRQLAQTLGITVHTITKAYAEVERSGLVVSRTGRGTFVKVFPEEMANVASTPGDLIDLCTNTPSNKQFNAAFAQIIGSLARRASLHSLFEYHVHPGLDRHRAAGARWIERRGINAKPEMTVVCQGAQEGLLASLAAITRPRDIVLTEKLNYAGIKYIADILHLNIRGVDIDEHGLIPESLEAACRQEAVAAVLVNPTNHNPTNACLPLDRRKAIADITARAEVFLIEDDVFGHISGDDTPSLAALAPDRCIYVCGTSKSIAVGLGVGYVLAPEGVFNRIIDSLHKMHWNLPALMGEITTMLIDTGHADEFVNWRRREAKERQKLANTILEIEITTKLPSNHIWIPLPEPWRSSDFVANLRAKGVLVAPSDKFAVGYAQAPQGCRLSLGCEHDRERLIEGLRIVSDTYNRLVDNFMAS
jgi:DNA-binding transcriptional MocR family regulator